jgi:hypothetical protein
MTKAMISPSSRDAPRFSSKRPQELRRFVRQMEDLWREAGIDDDEVKKESLGKYADQESEEEWRSLDNYPKGNTWQDFKDELIENYPEAAEAERGTPARLKQVCRETQGIGIGDLGSLYTFRRQFLAEAKKLSKEPAAMSNREFVELFIGSLSPAFAAAIFQYLGNQADAVQARLAGGPATIPKRPEDRYKLEDVCKAAVHIAENSQGMLHLMNKSGRDMYDRKTSTFNQYQSESAPNNLVQKLESLENSQAEEKDKLDMANKNMDSRFNNLEGMMKTLLNQVQNGTGNKKEPFVQYDPNMGVKLGQPGTIPRWGPTGNGRVYEPETRCFYCGGKGHYIPECDELRKDLKTGYVMINEEKKLRMPDGGYIPNIPNGAFIKEKIERYNMRKQSQFYCGYEEDEEPVIPRYPAQFVNSTAENPIQRHKRLEKVLDLEEELELRRMKLEREEKKSRESASTNVLELLEQLVKGDNSKSGFH